MNAVVPSTTEAVIDWLPIVMTGSPDESKVEVTPLTTTVDPEPSFGMLYVVPSIVRTPPAVRV